VAVHVTERTAAGFRQRIVLRERVPVGAQVLRNADAVLLATSRASYENVEPAAQLETLSVRLFGAAGSPLKAVFTVSGRAEMAPITVRSTATLQPADRHALDERSLRTQLGRLGDTPFTLGEIDCRGLKPGMFLPVSELNHLRQEAVSALLARRDATGGELREDRRACIEAAVADIRRKPGFEQPQRSFVLAASVYTVADARTAADAGATEVIVDPFLRHPAPPAARLRALVAELADRDVAVWLRLPTIVRPPEHRDLAKWLDLGLPVVTGHLGLAQAVAREGRRVTADYAVNCFNPHSVDALLDAGVERLVLSVELTAAEIADTCAIRGAGGLAALVYGRPEGMTIEHCVLSAAFNREPTTCRDLCVEKHPNVELTDPAGYHFAVATDSACRNRLLHSRPIEASEFLPALWRTGLRIFHVVFNVPGDPIAQLVAGYAAALHGLAAGESTDVTGIRALMRGAFTRGHFARAV
jgi:putative protease